MVDDDDNDDDNDPPRRTPLGPALSVRLIESQIKGINKGRDQL